MTKPTGRRVRQLFTKDPHGFYQEPPEASALLFASRERFHGSIIDPACGEGRVVKSARRAGYKAAGFDLIPRGFGVGGIDFLFPGNYGPGSADNIVSNPPFHLWERFLARALVVARHKVVFMLDLQQLAGEQRRDRLWLTDTPLVRVYVMGKRMSCPPGGRGINPERGWKNHAWYVWHKGARDRGEPVIRWL